VVLGAPSTCMRMWVCCPWQQLLQGATRLHIGSVRNPVFGVSDAACLAYALHGLAQAQGGCAQHQLCLVPCSPQLSQVVIFMHCCVHVMHVCKRLSVQQAPLPMQL
jgi:hypothetical protein